MLGSQPVSSQYKINKRIVFYGNLPIFIRFPSKRKDRIMSTLGIVLTKPSKAMGRISPQEPLSKAWSFFVLLYVVVTVISFLSTLLLLNVSLLVGDAPSAMFIDYLIQLSASTFATVLFILLWTGTATFVIHCTGGSQYSTGRTLQAILYSGCTMVFSIIPCAGSLISFVWWIVAATKMIQRGHRISTTRAIAAGLSGVLATVIPCAMIWGAMIYPTIGTARAAARQAQFNAQQQMQNPPVVVDEVIDQSSTQLIPADSIDNRAE